MTALRRQPGRNWIQLLGFVIFLLTAVALAVLLGRQLAEDRGGSAAGHVGTGSLAGGEGSPVVINQAAALDALFPGAAPQVLSGTFTNRGGSAVFIGSVEAALAGVSGGLGSCTLESYRIDNPVMPVDRRIPVGENVGQWGGATVRMVDEAASQDGCKLATVTIAYTAR